MVSSQYPVNMNVNVKESSEKGTCCVSRSTFVFEKAYETASGSLVLVALLSIRVMWTPIRHHTALETFIP